MTVVIGIALIAAIQFSRTDTNHAIAVLSVFIAASTRIAPAVMRLQQSTITIKSYLASSKPTLDLADQLNHVEKLSTQENKLSTKHLGFNSNLEIEKVSFKYPGEPEFTIHDVSMKINAGSLIAFVGPSGGGKSTLVDLILGVIEPTEGKISVSGVKTHE
jgi:ABC-type multidrug transport system fused ATPase/permease subunit